MVDVNGDITPTLHEKVETVDANTWNDLSISDLQRQMETLQTRLMYAHSLKNEELVTVVQQGIVKLQHIINNFHITNQVVR